MQLYAMTLLSVDMWLHAAAADNADDDDDDDSVAGDVKWISLMRLVCSCCSKRRAITVAAWGRPLLYEQCSVAEYSRQRLLLN